MKLSDLRSPAGANKDRKRVGRGHGSGHVKTSGRGQKGQKSRTGGNVSPRFQGGQTPIQQQLPYKRGFKNLWTVRYNLINLEQLEDLEAGTQVIPEMLKELSLIRDKGLGLKILGDGALTVPLHVTANKVSEGARQKIEAAGGTVTLLETPVEPHRSKGRTEAPVRAYKARQAERNGSDNPAAKG